MKRATCTNPNCKGGNEIVTVILHTPVELFVRQTLRPWLQPNMAQQKLPCHVCRPEARAAWEERARERQRSRMKLNAEVRVSE